MDVKIGMHNVTRELIVEVDHDAAAIDSAVSDALSDNTPLKLTDKNGRQVIVRAESIAYVDLGGDGARPVGFGMG